MLTDEAQFERRWGGLPLLAKLLGQQRLSTNAEISLYGPTSVSDNIFEQFHRLMETVSIVKDQQELLREFLVHATPNERDQLMMELEQVRGRLQGLGGYLHFDLAGQVNDIRTGLNRTASGKNI